MECVPSVGLESLLDILGERDVGVSINSDVVVIVDGDKVLQLEVTVGWQSRVNFFPL